MLKLHSLSCTYSTIWKQLHPGAASICIQSIHWIPSKFRLWLYFNVFRKNDLW